MTSPEHWCDLDPRHIQQSCSLRRRELLLGASALAFSGLVPPPARASASLVAEWNGWLPIRPLEQPVLAHSLRFRCREKPVLAELMIDDMETAGRWTASDAVTLTTTSDRAIAGTRSLRFSVLTRDEAYITSARSENGSFTGRDILFPETPFAAVATLKFDQPQDWTKYNRISLWCYLHPTVHPLTTISLQFLCQGASAGPSDPIAIHYIGDLTPGAWNLLTWEISEYTRDRVSEFVLFKPISGNPLKLAEPRIVYDFDQLKLETVDVEPPSGWSVTLGKIAYSHLGYRPASRKIALCGEPAATTFDLLDSASGRVVATLPVRHVETRRGRFALLDFSDFRAAGKYRLRCAGAQGETFEIAEQIWTRLIDTTLNSYNGFRCGCPVPGLHDACHLDTFVEFDGERRVAGGGWHDAANLTQFGDLTHLSILALLRLYEQLQSEPNERKRASRTLEEVQWGLDWALHMRFGPGLRQNKVHQGYWTNGVVGDDDDIIEMQVERSLRDNIFAVAALAPAARILRRADRGRAKAALAAAQEDYAEILPSVSKPLRVVTLGDGGRGTWRDLVAYLALAAVELYRVTGTAAYAEDAMRFGAWLLELQETRFIDGSPVTGYFYADADRQEIQREVFGSCDDAGPLALQALCEVFPQGRDWAKWYAALLIYSEYYCGEGATASAPYDIIPASVWRKRDIEGGFPIDRTGERLAQRASPLFPTPPTEDLVRSQAHEMFAAGVRLNDDTRLRVFPLWYNHVQHGSSTAHLTRSIGLSCAARVRNRMAPADLVERQLHWILGGNPFSRSLIFGVGYDYWDNFTVSLTNFVGGMGMGMNSYSGDAPAWPNNAVFPYKEQWVYSANRLALNLAYTAAPARLHGVAKAAAELTETRTLKTWRIPKGPFSRLLPPGEYRAACGSVYWDFELAPGGRRELTLDPLNPLRLSVNWQAESGLSVRLAATAEGAGNHVVRLTLFNCRTSRLDRTLHVTGERDVVEWVLEVEDPQKPWIALLIPDSNKGLAVEAFGRLGVFQSLSTPPSFPDPMRPDRSRSAKPPPATR